MTEQKVKRTLGEDMQKENAEKAAELTAELHGSVVRGAENIAKLGKDWDDLFSRAYGTPPFFSRAWASTFVCEGRLRGTPLFILVWRGTKLVALFALSVRCVLGVRVAEPIGTPQSGYYGLLLDPNYPTAVGCVADLITSKKLFSGYYSADLSSEDSVTNELLTKLAQKGYSLRQVVRNPCPRIRLGCSFDDYLKNNKSGKSRQTIRRKERMLCKNEVEQEYYAGIEVTPQILRRIARIQQESWMRRRGAAVLHRPFYQKLLLEMAKAGFARVWLLTINSEDAAFVYALVAHKKLYYAWTAFKLKYATSLSIGMVLTIWTIRRACEEGILFYDFEHGDAEYKRFWSNECHSVHRAVAGQGLWGRLLVLCFASVWWLAKHKWLFSLYRRFKKWRNILKQRYCSTSGKQPTQPG